MLTSSTDKVAASGVWNVVDSASDDDKLQHMLVAHKHREGAVIRLDGWISLWTSSWSTGSHTQVQPTLFPRVNLTESSQVPTVCSYKPHPLPELPTPLPYFSFVLLNVTILSIILFTKSLIQSWLTWDQFLTYGYIQIHQTIPVSIAHHGQQSQSSLESQV